MAIRPAARNGIETSAGPTGIVGLAASGGLVGAAIRLIAMTGTVDDVASLGRLGREVVREVVAIHHLRTYSFPRNIGYTDAEISTESEARRARIIDMRCCEWMCNCKSTAWCSPCPFLYRLPLLPSNLRPLALP